MLQWDRLSWLYISCGNNTVWELGRWITSFHRRVGHWVTHSTPLLPMLFTNATGECLVEYKVSLNDPWVPYLNFRFSKTIGRNSYVLWLWLCVCVCVCGWVGARTCVCVHMCARFLCVLLCPSSFP